MDIQSAEVGSTRAFRLGDFLRDQLRNIAPFITLIVLVGFFSIASPSFASIGNLENILQQVSITAIMAAGVSARWSSATRSCPGRYPRSDIAISTNSAPSATTRPVALWIAGTMTHGYTR